MYYQYKNEQLVWAGSPMETITKKIDQYNQDTLHYDGPYYLYHADIFKSRIKLFESGNSKDENNPTNSIDALPYAFFSVKSLSNIHVLKLLKDNPSWGLDVVSIGEIERARRAGFHGSRIVFAGVGKTSNEISRAIEYGIRAFHVESLQELQKIGETAKEMNQKAGVALRMNPDVKAVTHEYITTGKDENKFGIPFYEFSRAMSIIENHSSLVLKGLQAHIGSQILEIEPFKKALTKLIDIEKKIPENMKSSFEYISLGGGFGIDYENTLAHKKDRNTFPVDLFLQYIKDVEKTLPYKIVTEPGRYISAYSGALLSHVLYNKEKNEFRISITDSGMSELIRPALYSAYHPILPIHKRSNESQPHDIVGPICESGDFFAKKYAISELKPGDKIMIAHAGAYSSTMASNYNSRPMVPEYLIEGEKFKLIRKPQTIDQLLENETSLL